MLNKESIYNGERVIMVIGNSNFNMEATRSFKASSTAVSLTVANGAFNATKLVRGVETGVTENVKADESSKTNSFQSSLRAFSRTEKAEELDKDAIGDSGFNLGRRRFVRLNKRNDDIERMSAKKVREQSILYFLLRLKRILQGEDSVKNMADDFLYKPNQSENNADDSASSESNNVIGYRFGKMRYEESEVTEFNTTGKVVTKDGRELSFNVALSMSRSFTKAVSNFSEIVATSSNLIDPLVINLDMNPASVSDQKFMFDLDADGEEESISMLSSGSGFLALDKNNDGIINDGSELFGTKSGDGFGDLSEYDDDGNGWIDEADEIFSKLRIWTKDEDGNDKLYKLKDLNVGALCLQNVDTNFSLKDSANNTEGVIKHTGFFLYEDGKAGTMQHMDIAT